MMETKPQSYTDILAPYLPTPSPPSSAPSVAETPQQILDARPVVGTQKVMGMDVPIRQAGTLEEQRAGANKTQVAPPPTPEELQATAAMGMSALGSAGGAAAGGALAGVPGAVAGEALGSYAARKANVALGLEEPGLAGDVLSVAVPPVVRGAGALVKPLLRRLPGAAATLHEGAAKELQSLPEKFLPTTPSQQLYAIAAQQSPPIATAKLAGATREVLAREAQLQPSLQNRRVVRVATDLQDLIAQHGGDVPLQVLQATQQRLGLLVRQASSENWPEERALKQLYKSFYDDLEGAAAKGTPGAQTLIAANKAARKEFATADLQTMFAPGHPGIQTRPDGLVTLNGGKLRDTFEKKLAADDLFRGSFTADDLKGIRAFFTDIERLPRIPPGTGQTFGFGGTAATMGGAAAATYGITGNKELATMVALAAPYLNRGIGALLMSDPGRKLLTAAIKQQGGLSPALLGVINEGGRQVLEEGQTVTHPPLP